MQNKKIVILSGPGNTTNAVFNSINNICSVDAVITEDKEPRIFFLKRRVRRLGLGTVIGQVAFQIFIVKPLSFFSAKRIKDIIRQSNIDLSPVPSDKIIQVSSVNSEESIQILENLNPDLIIVNGTRIISKKVLRRISGKFINTHFGITPMYRGVHGTYWALVNKDPENSGVTVHFVDEGIDTGNIIETIQVIPTAKDNFTTYPFLQLAAGLKILPNAIKDFFEGNIRVKEANGKSDLWYHPTIWKYIYHRIVNKVK